MESPIKLDLSRLSYPAILQITIPFVPGGVFTCGLLYLDLAGVRALVTTPMLPSGAKIALFVFGAYVVGLLLHGITTTLLSWLGYGLGLLLGRHFVKSDKSEPWKNRVWRKIAREYLGPLAPTTDEVHDPEIWKNKRELVNTIADPAERARQFAQLVREEFALIGSDSDWFWWHSVIRERLPRERRADAAEQSFSAIASTLFSLGWSGVILLCFAPRHPMLWLTSILAIVAGMFGDASVVFSSYFSRQDAHATELTARMLKAMALTVGEKQRRE